ncbi:MAG: STAS domain-containing protein [Clostridiales bacterium]|nr:STAS domain-containing protein [Candidatus Scatonaster coprocaballi]
MNVKKTIEASKMEIALDGKFDAISAPQFEAEIKNDLDRITELYIDMSAVEYISSAGLRTLLFLQQTMEEKGRMVVRNVPEVVSSVFEVTGFDEIITIE